MSENTNATREGQFPRLELLGNWGDDTDGLSDYERRKILDRMAAADAAKSTSDDSGVRRRDEIKGAEAASQPATEIINVNPVATAEASADAEQFELPKFGSFIGYEQIRAASVNDALGSFNRSFNLTLDKGVKAPAAPVEIDIAFDHSELEAAAAAGGEAELDKEISQAMGDDVASVTKKQKENLIGIIHHYNNAAELSYLTDKAKRKSSTTPGRLANLWGYVKRPVRGLIDLVSPSYAINRNEYESHMSFAETAKEEAKNRLEADVQSISDSYEVMADYVEVKFGEEFAFDVDDNAEVKSFLNDCLNTPDSPHYKMIMTETMRRVELRKDEYNDQIDKINREANSAKYEETTKDILASSLLLRMRKGISDTFSDLKKDVGDLWTRITGRKAKPPVWTKRDIPTVLGAAVAFKANHEAYIKDDNEAGAEKLEKKIVKEGNSRKRTGFLLAGAAAIAGLLGGGYLIKKVVDGSLNNKAETAMADADKAVKDKANKKADKTGGAAASSSASAEASNSNNIPASIATLPNTGEVVNTPVDGAKSVQAKGSSNKPLVNKIAKAAQGMTTSQAKAKISTTKTDGLNTGKPKSEKVEEKKTEQKEVGDQPISEAMKMDEVTFGEKKLAIYTAAMEEITQPVELSNGKKVPYNPDILAFNAVLEKIGEAHMSLKTRKDVTNLHALYAQADRMIGEYQLAKDNLTGPNYIVDTEMNIGMARKSIADMKASLAGRSGKFQVVVPVKKAENSTEVNRVHDIDLDAIEKALGDLYTETHLKTFPSQKRGKWMVESSKYYRAQVEFAKWYLTHDAAKVRF